MFAITLSEFFASFLIIFKLGTWIDYSINKYETVGNFSVPIFDSSTESNCSVATTSISFHWGLINHLGTRLAFASYGIPFILSSAFITALMSYYIMAVKKSNTSLESMNLSREQKSLLWSYVVVCIILGLLLIRKEVYFLYELLRCTILLVQSIYTVRYSVILSRVLSWKVVDNRIAFGTESVVYKLHVKTWRSFKIFAKFLSIVIVLLCIADIIFFLQYILEIVIYPYELYILYGKCVTSILPTNLLNVLEWVCIILYLISASIQFAGTLMFLLTGVISIPYLLSKTNMRCFLNFRSFNTSLKKPLLI